MSASARSLARRLIQRCKLKQLAERETPHTPFEIVDTLTVCGAQMLIAIETSRVAAKGKNLPEVIDIANNMTKRVNCVSLSDDLYYLAKGGRIHKGHVFLLVLQLPIRLFSRQIMLLAE
ncbi:DegV family protein [Chloroflexota bacterium]